MALFEGQGVLKPSPQSSCTWCLAWAGPPTKTQTKLLTKAANMCRFTVTEPSQQVERDLADGFNWFDAIDEICEGEEDDQLLVKEEEQLEPQPGGGSSRTSLGEANRLQQALSFVPAAADNLLDVWCQQINGELAQAGATGWMAEPASAAMQQAPAATPALHQAPMYGFLGQVVVPQAHAGLASTSSGSVDDEFSCDGEQPMASGASDSQQKHSNNAAGKHTVKHTKVSKVGTWASRSHCPRLLWRSIGVGVCLIKCLVCCMTCLVA